MKRSTVITIAVLLGFVAFLAWSTLSAQKVTCDVCVNYNAQKNCASASHESEVEAARSAQTTACGPVSRGMNDAIACGTRPPVSQQCRAK
jgi:hypothetical protein